MILLLALATSAGAKSLPGTPDAMLDTQQRWGMALPGYLVSGCVPAPSASTTVSVPPCQAFVWEVGPPPTLRGFEDQARTLSLTSGDGTYLLLGRAQPGVIPAGATCAPGTHYCWTSGTPPPQPPDTVALARLTVSGGAVTAVTPAGAPAGQVYRPEFFGARGDGVQDDTFALIAMQAVMPPTGGVVQLAQGAKYRLNTAGGWTITKSLTLAGTGHDASGFDCGSGIGNTGCITITAAGVTVKDLYTLGDFTLFTNANRATTERRGNFVVTGNDAHFSGIRGYNCMSDCIRFHGTAAALVVGGVVEGSVFVNDQNIDDGTSANKQEQNSAVYAEYSDGLRLVNNRIKGHGIGLNPGAESLRAVVSGNVLSNLNNNAIYASGCTQCQVSGNIAWDLDGDCINVRGSQGAIANNLCSNTVHAGSNGIQVSGIGPEDGTEYNGRRLTITGNVLFGYLDSGIALAQVAGWTDALRDITITGNTVRIDGPGVLGTRGDGILVEGKTRNITVTGNILVGAQRRGISFHNGSSTGQASGTVITGNTIDVHRAGLGAGYGGIHLVEQLDCVVSGNTIKGGDEASAAIYLNVVDRCMVSMNHCGDDASPPGQRACIEEGLSQNARVNYYYANIIPPGTLYGESPLLLFETSHSQVSGHQLRVEALTAHRVIYPGEAFRYQFTANGNYNLAPGGYWANAKLEICNQDTVDTLTFDPLGLNDAIAPGECAIYWYDTVAWRLFYRG